MSSQSAVMSSPLSQTAATKEFAQTCTQLYQLAVDPQHQPVMTGMKSQALLLLLQGYAEAVSWLLQQGADANSPNQGGSTPLHSAAGHGQATAAEMLLYMGCANGSLLDMSSESPRTLALSLGHGNIACQIDLAQHVSICKYCEHDKYMSVSVDT
jgi:hypothetical protein